MTASIIDAPSGGRASDPATGARQYEVMAAVDLGSNSFHMKVARFEAGQLVVIDRLREMVRLAAGLDKSGRLDAASRERALACLARFGQRIKDMHADTVRVVATNTFRKARKAGRFRRRAEQVLGHPIEVVSGREEARLVYTGVAHSSPVQTEKLLVVDIGGGSTELIVGKQLTPQKLFSLQMGCVSITREFFRGGRITRKGVKKARIAVSVELEPVAEQIRESGWEVAMGASGTVRATAEVLAKRGAGKPGLTLEGLDWLVDRLVSFGHVDKLSLPGLDPERAPVFPGGVIVLATLFRELKLENMRVADGALREGILFDLIGRFSQEDARERSVRALQERYSVDQEQALRVETSAAMLMSQVARRWKLQEPQSEQLLRWAARTHELGLAIAHSGYHRHGAYLLENSDLPGFSTVEQTRLAALVALHRKRFDTSVLEKVHPEWRQRIWRLALVLRLAVVLHRGRGPGALPEIRMKPGNKRLRLIFPGAWLEEHPLSQADLEQESRYLAEAGFALDVR